MTEEDLITNTWNTGSFQLQRSPRCILPTHLLRRTQLHEEGKLRLVKADLVMLGKFFVAFTVRVRQGENLCQPPLQAGRAGGVEEGFQLSRCPLLLLSEKNADRWLPVPARPSELGW